jgi:hypothetical protein
VKTKPHIVWPRNRAFAHAESPSGRNLWRGASETALICAVDGQALVKEDCIRHRRLIVFVGEMIGIQTLRTE